MTVTATAHVNFRGQAREALTFYQSVFGGNPACPAPFAPLYGMVTDRFGVTWIVGVEAPAP